MPATTKLEKGLETQNSSKDIPTNWPNDIKYVYDHTYSERVTPEIRAALSRTTSGNETFTKIPPELIKHPCPHLQISIITDLKHPVCGQRGLFAAHHLEPDSFICFYLGHVHTNSMSDTDPYSDYDLSLDREIGLSVDAARAGNESRFANDYRGIGDRANAEFRDCAIQVPTSKRADGVKWERRVGIFVLSAGRAGKRTAGIKAGEEILVSYGKGFWEGRKTVASYRKDAEMLKIAEAALDW